MHSIRASMQSVSARRTFNEQSVHHQHSLSQFHQQAHENSSFDLLSRDEKFSKWAESENLSIINQDCLDSGFVANLATMSMSTAKFSAERSSSISKISEHDDLPPALPIKTRTKSTRRERHMSHYDNVEGGVDSFSSPRYFFIIFLIFKAVFLFSYYIFLCVYSPMHNKHRSLIEPKRTLFFDGKGDIPPPLPVKKKHSKHKLDVIFFYANVSRDIFWEIQKGRFYKNP